MKYLFVFFTLLTITLFPHLTKAEEMMRVRLVKHIGETDQIQFQFKGEYFTLDPTINLKEGSTYTLEVKNDSLLLKGEKQTYNIHDSLLLIPKAYNHQHTIHINDRPYLGAMELRLEDNQFIRPVNQLPLEDYLKGVVPFEVYPNWGIETLKAQALAARTYAVIHRNEEIDDTVSYQAYGGYTWNEKTTRAVNETKGEVITYKDQLIDAFYSASNGGMTENNAHVWEGKAASYFPIKEDPYDPVNQWKFTLHQTQVRLDTIDWDSEDWWNDIEEEDKKIAGTMKERLKRNGYPGEIKILSIPEFEVAEQQYRSKRKVKGSITIDFLHRLPVGPVFYQRVELEDVKLNRIRPLIGGSRFKSYLIDSLKKEDHVYTMKGKGFGHGVGMSQWGAYVMGKEGKSYEEIIEFYYPGTNISPFETEN